MSLLRQQPRNIQTKKIMTQYDLPTLRINHHTVSTVEPVVLRAARSACALAASFSV